LDPSALSVGDKILAQILVYPNPADDHIALKLPQSIDASLKIYNTRGQVVYYAKKQTLRQNHRIPISYLSKGNYVLRITTDHHTTTFKVMKN
jgi:DNA/RNA endonuclease YhcR with UshA esterase domain